VRLIVNGEAKMKFLLSVLALIVITINLSEAQIKMELDVCRENINKWNDTSKFERPFGTSIDRKWIVRGRHFESNGVKDSIQIILFPYCDLPSEKYVITLLSNKSAIIGYGLAASKHLGDLTSFSLNNEELYFEVINSTANVSLDGWQSFKIDISSITKKNTGNRNKTKSPETIKLSPWRYTHPHTLSRFI